jgi:hypothetical protein
MVMPLFPSTVYTRAWKTFRLRSNENRVTTEAILSFPYLINKIHCEKIRLLDIGCGDGLLVQEFVHQLCRDFRTKIEHVTLLDPYVNWLEEAGATLSSLHESRTIPELYKVDTGIEENIPNLLVIHNVIFAVHLVYLLEDGVFTNLIQSLPHRVPLYVVMDAPDSVFSQIWEKTQPSYLNRVKKAHKFINSLKDDGQYSITQESVMSKVDNPLTIEDSGIKNMILSMLSYSDYETLSNQEMDYINEKVKENSQGDKLRCKSICYEIFKR